MKFLDFLESLQEIRAQEGEGSYARKKELFLVLITDTGGQVLDFLDERAKKILGVNKAFLRRVRGETGGTDRSLSDVLRIHAKIVEASGGGSNSVKESLLAEIVGGVPERLYHLVQAYYTLGHPRIGLNQETIKKILSEMRGKPYDTRMSLRGYYDSQEVKAGNVKPMLASTLRNLSDELYHVEPKYDGIRVVLSIHGGKLVFSSRTGLPFPEAFSVSLGPFLSGLEDLGDVVLDGQLWIPGLISGEGFHKVSRLIRSGKPLEFSQIYYQVFDILSAGGVDYVGGRVVYEDRRKALQDWYHSVESKGFLRLTPILGTVNGPKVEVEVLRGMLSGEETLEGLVLKGASGTYEPGKRTTSWQKYKVIPQTVDLLVIGAEKGTGKNKFKYASFDLGADDRGVITPLAQVGTGFTEQELDDLNRRYSSGEVLVLQVAAQAMTKSKNYGCGYSLRFPRFVRVRDDKETPDTLERIKSIFLGGLNT